MIIVGGATATGKSTLAIEIAKSIGGELISADSMQIYRGMDIGTAKEKNVAVNQLLIDVVEPCEPFTVVDFRARAIEAIKDIRSRGNVPIIVGGTGLYMDSLLYKMEYGGGKDNPELIAANTLSIPVLTRAEILGQIMLGYSDSICISGTHGKTTATSMLSLALENAERENNRWRQTRPVYRSPCRARFRGGVRDRDTRYDA